MPLRLGGRLSDGLAVLAELLVAFVESLVSRVGRVLASAVRRLGQPLRLLGRIMQAIAGRIRRLLAPLGRFVSRIGAVLTAGARWLLRPVTLLGRLLLDAVLFASRVTRRLAQLFVRPLRAVGRACRALARTAAQARWWAAAAMVAARHHSARLRAGVRRNLRTARQQAREARAQVRSWLR